MSIKQRLSVSVDADLIEAAENAVTKGRSGSVSEWVNQALRFKLTQERRLESLSAFIGAYEAEHGEITVEEMRLAARRARAGAVAVRGMRAGKVRGAGRRSSSR
jgi:Arc/MetJ-type ribon-helix-helix transcriptional regulator